MRLNSLATALLTALLAFGCTQSPPAAGDISSAELQQRMNNGSTAAPLILDVRSVDEFQAGHLPGAINIPHTEIAARLNELPTNKDAEIVVHCLTGKRAGMAAETLTTAGFSRIRHLDGDYAGWAAAKLPLEQ
jgi:rhodanese-related sulfurtransferase